MKLRKRVARKKAVAIIKIALVAGFLCDLNALIDFLQVERPPIIYVNPSIDTARAAENPTQDAQNELTRAVGSKSEAEASQGEKSFVQEWIDGRDREMATIKRVAEEMGYSDYKALLRLAHCESRFDNARTNKNVSPTIGVTYDRGIFQFNDYWHPEMSEACARNTECATKRTIELVSTGTVNWSCAGVFHDESYDYLKP